MYSYICPYISILNWLVQFRTIFLESGPTLGYKVSTKIVNKIEVISNFSLLECENLLAKENVDIV